MFSHPKEFLAKQEIQKALDTLLIDKIKILGVGAEELVDALSQHVKSEFSSENINFLKDVKYLIDSDNVSSASDLKKALKALYKQYIGLEAETQSNLPDPTVKLCEAAMLAAEKSNHFTLSLFEQPLTEAVRNISMLMKNDSIARFQNKNKNNTQFLENMKKIYVRQKKWEEIESQIRNPKVSKTLGEDAVLGLKTQLKLAGKFYMLAGQIVAHKEEYKFAGKLMDIAKSCYETGDRLLMSPSTSKLEEFVGQYAHLRENFKLLEQHKIDIAESTSTESSPSRSRSSSPSSSSGSS